MAAEWSYYTATFLAVILQGLSKGGFSGIGLLSMPLMALVLSPVRAAAILLPILIVQDWVGIWAFRRDANWRNLAILMPASLIGIGLGWQFSTRVSESQVRLAVGLISVGFVIYSLLRARLADRATPVAKVAPGLFWGALAGFTSFVSHAGAPPFQVYVMPQKLNPKAYAGTAAVFFAAANLLKVPPYFALGQFSPENLWASAALVPIAIASTFAGVWLVKRAPAERFYNIILGLTFLVGLKLIFDAGRQMLG